ncbi:hypothetical protein F5880DRAFT_1619604 [Lentinula raphanica]|nr:hypothetical protein F5880DRAFT_1619604 [Lentinula raphanica]
MTSRQSRTSSNVPQDSTVEKDDTPNIPETVDVYPSATETKEGWIWHHGSLKNMSPFELEKWEDKSDSVQWFRAEADMERWQEQLEIKHAEFLRLITSFTKHRDAWDLLAKRYSTLPGHLAYAQEHRDLFDSLRVDAQERYQQSAVSFLLYRDSGETLADRIVRWRREEEKWFKWATRPPFNDPTLFKHGGDTRVPVSSGETDTVDLAGVKRKFDLV